jgi:tetratricopeptide (TPR) repeat protein
MRLVPSRWAPLSLLIAAGALCAQPTPPSTGAPASRPAGDGKAALAAAEKTAALATGRKGGERTQALEAGAKAYAEVAEAFAADPAVSAEASFEAAELWRRGGKLEPAEAAYRKARELDGARYGSRATFELAHLLRRARKVDDAVAAYREVMSLEGASARAQEASLWIGRALQIDGRLEAALAAFQQALAAADTPRRAVTACNWLASTQVKLGDLEGAAATLAALDKQLEDELDGTGPDVDRLRRALDEMTARRALQRARDRKTDAAGDAAQLERSGSPAKDGSR